MSFLTAKQPFRPNISHEFRPIKSVNRSSRTAQILPISGIWCSSILNYSVGRMFISLNWTSSFDKAMLKKKLCTSHTRRKNVLFDSGTVTEERSPKFNEPDRLFPSFGASIGDSELRDSRIRRQWICAMFGREVNPDRPYNRFRASKAAARRSQTNSILLISWSWGSKIVKGSVRILCTSTSQTIPLPTTMI